MLQGTKSLRPLVLLLLCWLPGHLVAQETPLSAGETLQGTLAGGDTVTYAVEAGEEWYVFGEVDQISVDAVVRVVNPEGEQVTRVDVTRRGPDRFSGETREAGRHIVQVIAADDEGGDFAITLHRLEPLAEDPEELVDQLMSPYDDEGSPGAAVRVWRGGETLFSRAYGTANLAYDVPFETDTRTNIGSSSKQFTAFAVMLEAERGALSLDDDLREHVPELPAFDEPITIRHLLTHTSGLREIFNLLIMTGRRIDLGDYVDRDEILAVVQNQPQLQNVPGAEFNYNNTAFALAALIVERTSGMPFYEYMERNVFEPLGMSGTMVRPHPAAIVPNRSQGYAPGPEGYTEIRDLGAAVGAGGIYATVGDLQTWVENYASPEVGTRAMIDEMMTPYVLADGDTTGYGYGLFIDEQRGLRRVHHGGADIAHRSMVAYYPEIDAGITTQSNHAGFNSNVAFRIAEAFFEDAMEPEEPTATTADAAFDPASYEPEDFDELAGRYALDAAPSVVLTFSREEETLYIQVTGQPRVEIEPTSDTTFSLTVVEASVGFHRNEDGEVEGVTLMQGGQNQRATRLDGAAAEVWEPHADEFSDFVGRYFSEELETFFDVTLQVPGGDAEAGATEEEGTGDGVEKAPYLVLEHRRLDDVTLTPDAEDTFSGGSLTLSFERDRNGEVIGFYMSNVRTRDVRFAKIE